MRTRPPKKQRHPTPSEVYAELSGLLVEAGCEPLPKKQRPSFLPLSESPRGPDLTWADVESVLAELRALPPALPATPPPVVMSPQTFVALTTAPPPLALNLNVSTDVPTLETM